jgi:hypothetical protein
MPTGIFAMKLSVLLSKPCLVEIKLDIDRLRTHNAQYIRFPFDNEKHEIGDDSLFNMTSTMNIILCYIKVMHFSSIVCLPIEAHEFIEIFLHRFRK